MEKKKIAQIDTEKVRKLIIQCEEDTDVLKRKFNSRGVPRERRILLQGKIEQAEETIDSLYKLIED